MSSTMLSEAEPARTPLTKTPRRTKTQIRHITIEYMQDKGCFDMPLAEAAKFLGLGLSVMKRVCRSLGLTRWPYTTRTSLRRVIERTELYLADLKLKETAAASQKAHDVGALQSQAVSAEASACSQRLMCKL